MLRAVWRTSSFGLDVSHHTSPPSIPKIALYIWETQGQVDYFQNKIIKYNNKRKYINVGFCLFFIGKYNWWFSEATPCSVHRDCTWQWAESMQYQESCHGLLYAKLILNPLHLLPCTFLYERSLLKCQIFVFDRVCWYLKFWLYKQNTHFKFG